MSILFILALLLWAVAPASAQAQGGNNRAIEGMVLDPQGLPVTGARITLTARQGSTQRTIVNTTDRFRLDGLPAGVYDVRVEADGFEPRTVSADLRNQTSASV